MRDFSVIYLNGVRREVRGSENWMMLGEWLRKEVGLTGTKIVCAEGDCGACTVLRAFSKTPNHPLEFEAMNSCISTVGQMDGSHLVTVEGIQAGNALSPIQNTMRECHGSQCGYCTPGFIMALSAAFEKHSKLDAKTACNYLTGNLCRCTGYQPIIEAAIKAEASEEHSVQKRYLDPKAVDQLQDLQKNPATFNDGDKCFFLPVTIEQAVRFAADNPDFRVLGAATDLGVQSNKGKQLSKKLLSLHLIPDLYSIEKANGQVIFGARVTLAELRRAVSDSNPEFARFLDLFASPQIKNVATLVGNIANASPIGDTLPFLLVSEGAVRTASFNAQTQKVEKRTVPLTDFFLGYKKLALKPTEIITHVSFSPTHPNEILRLYKVSQRKDMDISTVSGAFWLKTVAQGKSLVVSEARFALGGVAATPIRLKDIEKSIKGQILNQEMVKKTAHLIGSSIQPLKDLRGSVEYRRVLAKNLFRKFGEEVLGV